MIKQVIVLRKDLNMRKGKMVAQGAHASMKVFLDRAVIGKAEDGQDWLEVALNDDMLWWVTNSFTKIALSCQDEDELVALYEQAKEAGLPCALIEDNGLTEFHGEITKTAIAIGPAEAEEIDKITGDLKLL